jgi:DNA-directed RNA polymerase subunit beta'
MDQVSLPNDMAWKLYEPFAMREMVRRGVPAMAAKKAIEDRSPQATAVLDKIMENRPVMLNRAPTLHKHNITGHMAKRHEGSAIRVPLATLSGWNADFDGDAMNVHVPVSDDAVDEIKEKMFPSKNLLSAKTMGIHMKPEQMALLGLYRATAPASAEQPVKFATVAEAIAAYNRGEINVNTPVSIEA